MSAHIFAFMPAPSKPFDVLPIEVLQDGDALEIAQRAWEDGDRRWVPITQDFADELREEGEVMRIDMGISVMTRLHTGGGNSQCICLLDADPDTWGMPALFRLMTLEEHMEWLKGVFGDIG